MSVLLPPAPKQHEQDNQNKTRAEIERRIEDMKRRLLALEQS
jgi:hypothetical protein